MGTSWTLTLAWMIFWGFLSQHHRHLTRDSSLSDSQRSIFMASVTLGIFVAVGLFGYSAFKMPWYQPLLMLLVFPFTELLLLPLHRLLGTFLFTSVGFIAWPAAALWGFMIVGAVN